MTDKQPTGTPPLRRRARVRLTAADVEPLVLLAVFLGVWFIGLWGFLVLPGQSSPLDAAYNATQLFFMEGSAEGRPVPWQLHLGRFAAPAVLGYAAVRGLLLLARGEVARWRARLFARGHVVVVGDSSTAQAVTAAARASVTAVVVSEDGSGLAPARSRLATFPGPVTDAVALAHARPDRARHVVVATGDDARNLEAMAAVQAALTDVSPRPVIHVELADAPLWRELHAIALSADGLRAPVEFFNLVDRQARALLDGMRDVLAGIGAPVRVIVSADERSESALVSHLIRRIGGEGRVTLILVGEDARAARERLRRALPWLDGVADVLAVGRSDIEENAGRELEGAAMALIDHSEAAPALALASLIARCAPELPAAVAVSDPAMAQALHSSLPFGRLRLVATREDALGAALFGESAVELIARAKHDDYVTRELAAGRSPADNPSLVDWDRLPESLRESNRRFAESVAAKLAELGARIVPLRGPAPAGQLGLDARRLEELAQGEHLRWMADLEAEGWRATDGPKDPERRLHPLLVPWDELSEADRDKDRDAYRALPGLLGRVGYEVVVGPRSEDEPGPAPGPVAAGE